jgi:TolB protein
MYHRAVGWCIVLILVQLSAATLAANTEAPRIGVFQGQADVGNVTPAGSAAFDTATGRYTLRAAGANTWYHVDAFHYLWLKTSGDWALTAEIKFPPHTYSREPNPHRKGVLMFRQSLDPGSEYAALALHGSGLTALQYRRVRGANTEDIEINEEYPQTLRIEKRGEIIMAYVSMHGEPAHPVGASTRIHLKSPFYMGLGALSHEPDLTDTVEFAQVAISRPETAKSTHPTLYSTLEVIQTEDQYRRATALRSAPVLMSSAAWSAGSKSIYVEEAGQLEQIVYHEAPAAADVRPILPGSFKDCPGHHGMSPDGKWLAVTCKSEHGEHQVYILPAGSGEPRQLTYGSQSSFFHAWSADGVSVAFTRGNGASKADIYTIPASGGKELRLTTDAINDGPDFSPDAKFIYFDSSRSGTTQIWRMHPDGSAAEQITDDEHENSSPHISPDGKSLAFLSRPANAGDSISDAAIRVMGFDDGLIRTLVDFQGNRDSLAMQSWGDRNHLAFISYQKLP